jgi:NADPH-dependent ferric siderophore reductase
LFPTWGRRRWLIADHGANPKWTRAAGYWRRGVVAVHDE